LADDLRRNMRAQAPQHGDSTIRAAYDWSSLKGKIMVDVGTTQISKSPED
jgi:hypothetical protein